jgi:hypothetical protein
MSNETSTEPDPEPDRDPDPGLLAGIGLWFVGVWTAVTTRLRLGAETVGTIFARRAGQTDDPTTLTDEPAADREERIEERAEAYADRIEAIFGPVLGAVVNLGRTVSFTVGSLLLRIIPKSSGVADRLIASGFNLKQNATGADALVMSAYGDNQVIPRPASVNSAETQYETANGEKYSFEGEGHSPYHMFGVPVVFTLRESAEVFEPIQAYLASQREQGNWVSFLRDSDDVTQIRVGSGISEDGELDGRVLNWNKAWEQYFQKITQEDLEDQHRLGRLAELDSDAKMRVVFYVIGAFLGGIATMLVILFILDQITGSSGTISLFLGGWLL